MPAETIKSLLFDLIHKTNGRLTYEQASELILQRFPDSAWKRSHWAYYRSQIKNGRFKGECSEEELSNLGMDGSVEVDDNPPTSRRGRRGVAPRDEKVKTIGDQILEKIRAELSNASAGDSDFRFKLNRWIFSRLHLDERLQKAPIKQQLWENGFRACLVCATPFPSLKNVEIHRNNSKMAYSDANCVLLCRPCHVEHHRKRREKSVQTVKSVDKEI